VDLPILNQNQGPIAEAKAKRQEAAAKFIAVQSKVLAEIDRATQVLSAAKQALDKFRALETEQQRQRDSVKTQFGAGAVGRVEVLNAEAEYLVARLARLDGEARFQHAIGAMKDALQQPFGLGSASLESAHNITH
jgi:outer membrane protein TolC